MCTDTLKYFSTVLSGLETTDNCDTFPMDIDKLNLLYIYLDEYQLTLCLAVVFLHGITQSQTLDISMTHTICHVMNIQPVCNMMMTDGE